MQFTGQIARQDWMTAPETVAVMAALTAEGADVRFVGCPAGPVRYAAVVVAHPVRVRAGCVSGCGPDVEAPGWNARSWAIILRDLAGASW